MGSAAGDSSFFPSTIEITSANKLHMKQAYRVGNNINFTEAGYKTPITDLQEGDEIKVTVSDINLQKYDSWRVNIQPSSSYSDTINANKYSIYTSPMMSSTGEGVITLNSTQVSNMNNKYWIFYVNPYDGCTSSTGNDLCYPEIWISKIEIVRYR